MRSSEVITRAGHPLAGGVACVRRRLAGMCGIAGIMYKRGSADIGTTMTAMLDSLKHRGPDSTGFALYKPAANGNGSRDHFTLWLKWDPPADDQYGRREYAAAQR